jgi:23S rRNA pseudouridine1911/1915/1917 synthase
MTDRVELQERVPQEMHGARLDQVAAQLFPQYSRSRLQAWIKSGAVSVDGQQLRPRDKVSGGASVQIDAVLEAQVGWQGQDIKLDIVYEDDDILVINKPAGLVVHPAAGHSEGTLVNALLAHAPELAQLPRAGIVHRLDMETSGLLVIARTLPAHHDLVAQLQDRTVKREYCAIVIGAMTGGGTIDAPMGRHARQRKKMAVLPAGGKPAITHYRLAQRFGHHTRISVNLETGRTHQIRVHLAAIDLPVSGDPAYGVKGDLGLQRQFLHAHRLRLSHPVTGDELEVESPLPDDLVTALETARRG